LRGIVEGFYGEPWSHAARLDVLSFVAARGMNAYVYAPKDDAKHRAQWREPYDAERFAEFRSLIGHARSEGISFGFAISPGLDIDYGAPADRAALLAKLQPFAAAGVEWFLLLLDDIPPAPGIAPRQADIARWLLDALRAESTAASLALCPTEYIGMRSSPYLAALAEGLPDDVDVMWTGPTVCSRTISAAEARARSEALGGRLPLLWDNYPVNDASMEPALHLGPYTGRDSDLADVTAGILCNPMRHPYASQVGLATAADFLRDPDSYDPDSSWRRAIDAVGGARRAPLRALAEACADGPLRDPSELDLARRVSELEDEVDGPGWPEALRNTAEVLRAAKRVKDDFSGDDPLSREVAPWAAAVAFEADAGLAALRLLQQVRPVTIVANGTGRACAIDAETAMQAAFMVLYAWSGVRRNDRVAFGPRFMFYSSIVQLADGSPALDVGEALREDRNAIDALCRLALAQYDAWCREPSTKVRVFVDGTEHAVGADGRFETTGEMVLVRDGARTTRVCAGDLLPFRDPRLT
jgi:hyaluronoglucosaminidase